MDRRMCLRGHEFFDRVCPECGEIGAIITQGHRVADNDRRAQKRLEDQPDRLWAPEGFDREYEIEE